MVQVLSVLFAFSVSNKTFLSILDRLCLLCRPLSSRRQMRLRSKCYGDTNFPWPAWSSPQMTSTSFPPPKIAPSSNVSRRSSFSCSDAKRNVLVCSTSQFGNFVFSCLCVQGTLGAERNFTRYLAGRKARRRNTLDTLPTSCAWLFHLMENTW